MNSSLHANSVVQALVACRARRQLRGTPLDTPETRKIAKEALWALLESRLGTWDPSAQTLAQWALHVLNNAAAEESQAA
jgi:hypothetical protein